MPPQSPFLARLQSSTPVILDGGLATHLETLGADLSGSLWSASLLTTNPSLIARTHRDFYAAGADIAITTTYQASVPGLVKHLGVSEEEANGLIVKSVELAREERDAHVSKTRNGSESGAQGKELWIAGSVGPYGAFLADGSEYRGDYKLSISEFKDFHRGRIDALLRPGSRVDVLAIETIPSFDETRALVDLLATEFPEAVSWVTFTLRDEKHISDGTPVEEVIKLLEASEQVVAVGVNCVPEEMALGALEVLKGLTRSPLVVYPNSGETWNAEKREWEGERKSGERLAERVRDWWTAGARLIGGCCRTTPEDIKIIAETLKDIGK
ncbi:Homocysteine S-methyltransferase [Dendryphion nanum]|uniref:Homocysteine S-methyltransferase n=1 Tax=Dendryphion nanum TaxID=256645 RepID=A0A9P9EJA4_9PLEO|nr:Homocysteine S-methyltransferase [Dendryphion nanum]